MKSQYELNGGTYTEIDGINYPNIAAPEPDPRAIGIWGMRHEEYLKEHRYLTYVNLLTTGKLDRYLADVDEQARNMLDWLISQMAKVVNIPAPGNRRSGDLEITIPAFRKSSFRKSGNHCAMRSGGGVPPVR